MKCRLEEVCTIRYGKDHKCLADGNIPVYGSGGVMRYVDTALYDKKSVLIPRIGSLNNLFFVCKPFWTVNTLFYTVIDETKVIPQYLYYFLKTRNLEKMNVGSAVPSLTASLLNKIEIDLPSFARQKMIVAILSSLDGKIENNRKIGRRLEEMAQAIFRSWFVDFEPFGGVMPPGWKTGRLADIADVTMGQAPDGKSYNEEGRGTVFYQGRSEFGFRFPSRRLFTTLPKRMAGAGDVLMSVRAPVGDCNVAIEPCSLGRGLAGIRSRSGCQSFVLYTIFALKGRLDLFNGEGTVFGTITRKGLENLPVLIPAEDWVRRFEKLAHSMDAVIEGNHLESERLAAVRDALLPRLMSGEIEAASLPRPPAKGA